MSKERTINGKPFDQVISELKKEFEYFITDSTEKFKTLSIEQVEERLNDVLGLNYSFDLLEPPSIQEVMGSWSITGSGKITVYDDDSNFVCSRTGGGGCNVILVEAKKKVDNGRGGTQVVPVFDNEGNAVLKPKDLTDDYKAAIADIMKNCARHLSVGLYLVIERKQGKYVKNNATGAGENGQTTIRGERAGNDNKNEGETFTVCGVGVVKSRALRIPVRNASGEEGELVIWESLFPQLPIENLKKLRSGDKVHALAKYDVYNGTRQFRVVKAEHLKAS